MTSLYLWNLKNYTDELTKQKQTHSRGEQAMVA